MASAWRIVLASEAAGAFSGEGSGRYGGRWNSRGVRIIYASEYQSTVALEVFIHNNPFSPDEPFTAFRLEWPDSLIETYPAKKLPADWKMPHPSASTMEIGDKWARENRSVVLAVPSAIVPVERNFLLNPAHPDFKRIKIHPAVDFCFDPRLIGR